MMILKGKRVLVMGLGFLGGGVAAARWFYKQGVKVTITDLKNETELRPSLQKLGGGLRRSAKFTLGEHRMSDFLENDIVVVNPGVPKESRFLKVAREAKKTLVNEASVFFDLTKNPIIAVTGTKGKTTTTNWAAHLMGGKFKGMRPIGNSSEKTFFGEIDGCRKNPKKTVLAEFSSWHLEFLAEAERGPKIALITNIKEDHLNRYDGMEEYANAKANIFAGQKKNDFLVLNSDDKWTEFFIDKKPTAHLCFFSAYPLPTGKDGAFCDDGLKIRFNGRCSEAMSENEVFIFLNNYGKHNFYNLMAAMILAYLAGVGIQDIRKRIKTLPSVKFRQETVFQRGKFAIINDSTATSPEAGTAALWRFADKGNLVLIAGGTDKGLDYKEWALKVRDAVRPENLFLLQGSATEKMKAEFDKIGYGGYAEFNDFEPLVKQALKKAKERHSVIVLFSPAAASFEKFKNEFDRGERFNELVTGNWG